MTKIQFSGFLIIAKDFEVIREEVKEGKGSLNVAQRNCRTTKRLSWERTYDRDTKRVCSTAYVNTIPHSTAMLTLYHTLQLC